MTVKLHFHGAARTVTGSCYLIETDKAKVVVDCGMFQGTKTLENLNYRQFPFDPSAIDALVLTHAHIDHTGVVPKLTKQGFKKSIHCTPGTDDLCAIMLPDSGHIQETDVLQLNQRLARQGKPEVLPIYTMLDAQACLSQFVPHPLEEWFSPAAGIRMRFWNAGHLLGSASIETEIDQAGGKPIRLLFSGDIGPDNKMLEHQPEGPTGWDYVVMESTYGGVTRFERSVEVRRQGLGVEVKAAADRGGALLIPSFAVERTQELVTDLVLLMDQGAIPKATIFIDSPLANKATAIFQKHSSELMRGADLAHAFTSPQVRATETVEDSKALNLFKGFFIVVAASGMCEAGRIRHHLLNHLWQRSTTVLLAGYQAAGTLGQQLLSGAKMVTIMGKQVNVAATIRSIEDYSGHADGEELVKWITNREPVARNVFITHGEEARQQALAAQIAGKIVPPSDVIRPQLDEAYELSGPKAVLAEQASADAKRLAPAEVVLPDVQQQHRDTVNELQLAINHAQNDQQRAAILHQVRNAISPFTHQR